MEVLTDCGAPVLISNAEVMTLLERKISKRKEKLSKLDERRRKQREAESEHRDWIEEKVFEYLKGSPCVNVDVSKLDELHSTLTSCKRQRQTADASSRKDPVKTTKTTSFGLTEAEAIQVSNFMPTEPVEIHLMVEELHDRMTESRQEELLQCISSYRKDSAEES